MRKALLQLHASVFLAGFTGILGVLIELNEGLLVWYRMAITVVTLLALLVLRNKWQHLPFTQVKKLLGIGMLIALHWVFFYGSIKMANVSIGLVCVAGAAAFLMAILRTACAVIFLKACLLISSVPIMAGTPSSPPSLIDCTSGI